MDCTGSDEAEEAEEEEVGFDGKVKESLVFKLGIKIVVKTLSLEKVVIFQYC